MNLCVVLFQAIIFAVLVVQYQFFTEVEAEKPTSFSVGNWFNSIEKKINVQFINQLKGLSMGYLAYKYPILLPVNVIPVDDTIHIVLNLQFPYDEIQYEPNVSDCTIENGKMSDVFQNIRKTAEDIVQMPRRQMSHSTTNTDNLPKKEDVKFNDGVLDEDWAEINAVGLDASDVTGEKNDADQDSPTPEQISAIKKKRIRKHKRKNRNKERMADISMEKDKAEFGRRIKKERKKKVNKRRFVKTSVKESNVSDSDESMKRGKPVDIIVHIKMNE